MAEEARTHRRSRQFIDRQQLEFLRSIHFTWKIFRSSMLRIRSVSGNSPCPAIFRRTYSVPGPNALWHIDGNHKMIRWHLVVHGCIDGFSRVITFLQCSSNNCSDTVLDLCIRATSQYGTPSRVRTDQGGENVQVWRLMEEVRGRDKRSYIAGSSVHSTRIERLWRDVYMAVTSRYVSMFSELEERNLLYPDNETDLFCLHCVFTPTQYLTKPVCFLME